MNKFVSSRVLFDCIRTTRFNPIGPIRIKNPQIRRSTLSEIHKVRRLMNFETPRSRNMRVFPHRFSKAFKNLHLYLILRLPAAISVTATDTKDSPTSLFLYESESWRKRELRQEGGKIRSERDRRKKSKYVFPFISHPPLSPVPGPWI